MSWPWLPLDVYVHILNKLPISVDGDDSSTRTLLNCCQASSHIREAAILSSIWEPHYRARYTFADKDREMARKDKHGDDWRLIFYERRRLDCLAVKLLDEIIEQRSGRTSRARKLELFYKHGDGRAVTPGTYAFTRRYWAKKVQGVIARQNAIGLWAHLSLHGSDDVLSFEDVLAGLSAFFDHTSSEIITQLDALAIQCRDHLIAAGHLSALADMHDINISEICTSICAFLRSQGFEAAGENFHHLFNHFPHRFLSTHRKTIPLSLVYVFVAIARRLGIAVSPTDFPHRVTAHVSSPNPDVADIYIDVYGSRTKTVLSARDDIPRLLLQAGITPASMLRYIAPCAAAPMLLRAAQNILSSLRMLPLGPNDVSEADCQAAMYASYCVNILITGDNQLIPHLVNHLSDFPLDLGPVLHDTFAPLLHARSAQVLTDSCKDAMAAEEEAAKVQNRRSGSAQNVKYFVGMIFEHARQGYLGCIRGWEPTCMATEDWIVQMDIDSLPRGRDQPFYHVFALTGLPERYVAEENIRPLRINPLIVTEFVETIQQVSRYFDNAEVKENGWGRMCPSPESRLAYPEDEDVANEWVLAQPNM